MAFEDVLDTLCNDSSGSFNPFESGYVKPCFTDVAIYGLVCVWALVAFTVRLVQTLGAERKVIRNYWAHSTKVVCLIAMALASLVSFLYRFLSSSADLELYMAVYYIATMVTYSYSLLTITLEFDRGLEHNWAVKSTWTLAFIGGAVKLQTMVALLRDDGDYKIELPLFLVMYAALTVISVLALFFPMIAPEDRPHTSEYASVAQWQSMSPGYGSIQTPSNKGRNDRMSASPSPEDQANIVSQLTFWWMNDILALGHKRALEEDDLYPLAMADRTASVADMFRGCWQRQLDSDKPSVLKALLAAFLVPFLIGGLFKVVQDFLTFMGPLFLNLIIKYVMGNDPQQLWYGVSLAGGMMLCSVVQSLSLQTYFFKVFRVGMHLRAAIVTIVYSKAFRLSPKARQSSGVGDIVNHMAIDAERLMNLTPYLHMVWSGPVQVIVSLVLLWLILSWSVLAGLAVMVLMIPVNALVVKKLTVLQKQMMGLKDKRVKAMNETLQGIRLIKFFAWEDSFQAKIDGIRDDELAMLRKSAYLRAVLTFLWMSTPLMVSIVTFIVYTLAIDDLSADVAFTSISLFNILRFPLNMLPSVISGVVEARVSLNRLGTYLLESELDETAVDRSPATGPVVVSVHGGVFRWDRTSDDDAAPGADAAAPSAAGDAARADRADSADSAASGVGVGVGVGEQGDRANAGPTLSGVDLEVRRGQLMAVIGQVGAGKSSLLEALLGTIPKLEGRVAVAGRVAYVAQEACIQNATLRDNVLFGLPFDEERYQRAVRVCELEQDIAMLPAGDQTEIGEKGINLSGGQKQRVSMARAVYSDADVYLLDDPLSAVDAHVGKAIFENCIVEALKGKTRVLVTHQLQYLSQVDVVAVLHDKAVAELGSYEELMAAEGAFSELINKHVLSTPEEDAKAAAEDAAAADGTVLGSTPGSVLRESVDSPARTPARTPGRDEGDDGKGDKGEDEKATLIQKEDRQVGEVKAAVYVAYIASLGGALIVAVILVLFMLEQATKVGADYWVSWWTDDTTQEGVDSDGNPVLVPNHSNSFYLGIYTGIGVANACATLLRGIFTAIAGINSAKYLHERLLANVLRVPMAFFDTTPVGRILNRFSKDQYVVDEQLPRTLSMFVVMMFAAVAVLVVIGSVTPFFLTALLPLGWLYRYVQKYYLRSSRELKRLDSISRSPIYAHFSETLEGVTTIRAYGRAEAFTEENFERINRNQRAYFVSQVANRWLGVRLEFLGTCVVTLAALFAVLEKDNIDPGSAGLSITYALQTTALLNWMVRMYTEVETQMVAVERLEEYSTVPQEAPAVIEYNRPPKDWPSEGAISFKHLQLRYREGLELVLKDVHANVRPREKIGVVGRTGAGKSTLMLALFRMVEPAGGSVVVDGIDITQIGLADLRSKLSIIPQDPTLFTGTVRSNLDPFDQFPDHKIWAALEAVHLKDEFMKLDKKLLEEVNEGGQNLSVGQRQLMCLARALMRRSRILVMDEATAAVDFETDSLIQETIRREFKDMTVLTIAHRVNTIIDSDRVMVLDAGRLVEFDSPQRLLQNEDSLFYSLVNKSQAHRETSRPALDQ